MVKKYFSQIRHCNIVKTMGEGMACIPLQIFFVGIATQNESQHYAL